MITNFFIPELNNHDVQELWFQRDGATCHTALATIDLLKDTFGDRLISRFGPMNWPPRSCDLTPLDYFLWGYVKSLVYADKPQTLDHLEDNIRRVIADIRPHMVEKVIKNWMSRLDYIRASRGSHVPEIIFKIDQLLIKYPSSTEEGWWPTEIVDYLSGKSVVVLDETKQLRGGYVTVGSKRVRRTDVVDRIYLSAPLHQIESATHYSVAARTIPCRLQQSGLCARRPLLGLPLTQNHRRLRHHWGN
ncbi:uncharacterized protein TNCV_949611 [Trichonephila clavipes]|nr:uncharacterized protein TNCV_949611 [Trichonephila clavipes]